MKQVWMILLAAIIATVGGIAYVKRTLSPPVETIVASSLKSLQTQNRLAVFAARFVTVVTTRKEQLGFAAEKTLIMPAMIRYEVDMAKLTPSDIVWDEPKRTLKVTLPQLELSGPEFDIAAAREYGSGAVLMTLTDVERLLDQSNRAKARTDVLAQAGVPVMMKLAEDSATKAVANNFALPLRAAGVEANVIVEIK
jgi:Protein of unknown function (DUF4230)